MPVMHGRPWTLVLAFATLAGMSAGEVAGARLRLHYPPGQGQDRASFYSGGSGPLWSDGASAIGTLRAAPRFHPPGPVRLVTLRHKFTGQPTTVPLALPEGTPTIEHRLRRTIYNYGSYAVEVVFLPDGSVDVVYNSGLLRAP